mmetsp:Transcript_36832/g.89466  ORF Transcript_36832/g.89466 Transcript_36832/m.89466 type:complete len:321 (-) Transcript_36832:1547-2509(-)
MASVVSLRNGRVSSLVIILVGSSSNNTGAGGWDNCGSSNNFISRGSLFFFLDLFLGVRVFFGVPTLVGDAGCMPSCFLFFPSFFFFCLRLRGVRPSSRATSSIASSADLTDLVSSATTDLLLLAVVVPKAEWLERSIPFFFLLDVFLPRDCCGEFGGSGGGGGGGSCSGPFSRAASSSAKETVLLLLKAEWAEALLLSIPFFFFFLVFFVACWLVSSCPFRFPGPDATDRLSSAVATEWAETSISPFFFFLRFFLLVPCELLSSPPFGDRFGSGGGGGGGNNVGVSASSVPPPAPPPSLRKSSSARSLEVMDCSSFSDMV